MLLCIITCLRPRVRNVELLGRVSREAVRVSSKKCSASVHRHAAPGRDYYRNPNTTQTAHHQNVAKKPARQILSERKWPLLGAGVVATSLGLYVALLLPSIFAPSSACQRCSPSDLPPERSPASTAREAEGFDRSLDLPEWLSGIKSLRQRLATKARGHVLEVAVGTGRNLAFYNWAGLDQIEAWEKNPSSQVPSGTVSSEMRHSIESFTGVDISVDMMNVALAKLARTVLSGRVTLPPLVTDGEAGGEISYLSNRVRLVIQDAKMPLPTRATSFDNGTKYDTVIQTFGLCSVSDPSAVLANLASSIEPDTGRIILLEHGLGTWGWINKLLDEQACAHFNRYGCWWNRDIEEILRNATDQVPGLEIIHLERPYTMQMGTVIYAELKVSRINETSFGVTRAGAR